MNGTLFNNDRHYYNCLNEYRITFKDGTVKYTRAKNKLTAEENVCWFGDVDKSDDIILVEEL